MRADRAISIKQPWADLIIEGMKSIETRTWKTNYRGLLGIHASKKVDRAQVPRPDNYMPERLGALLGHVFLIDCRPMLPSDEKAARCPYVPGKWAWILLKPKEHDPEPMKGGLGIWKVPPRG